MRWQHFFPIMFSLHACYGRANLTCKKHSDCPLNASCENQSVCFCNFGYISDITDSLRCIKEATIYGDYCEQDIQCNGLLGLRSHCHFYDPKNAVGKCICNLDSHYRDGICYKNSYIGDKCKVNADCLIKNTDLVAYCEKRKCTCPPKHVPSTDNTDCLLAADLDEKCGHNVSCKVPNSICNGYCMCDRGYVPNKYNLLCLKAAEHLDDDCVEESQCIEFLKLTTCDTNVNKCSCRPSTHRLVDHCYLSVELEGLCQYDAECIVEGSRAGVECRDGTCLCKDTYVAMKKTCVLRSEVNFDVLDKNSFSTHREPLTYLIIFTLFFQFFSLFLNI